MEINQELQRQPEKAAQTSCQLSSVTLLPWQQQRVARELCILSTARARPHVTEARLTAC